MHTNHKRISYDKQDDNSQLVNYNTAQVLGRGLNPRANGAWQSKLTEWKLKCLS